MNIRGDSEREQDLEGFNEASGSFIMRCLGIVTKWYTFASYHEFRGTFSIELDDSVKLVNDRIEVYGKIYGCEDLVEAKKNRFLYRLQHLVTNLLDAHPIRWYHFGRDRKDLILYRSELEEVQRRLIIKLQGEKSNDATN